MVPAKTIQPTHPVTSDSSGYRLGTDTPPADIDVLLAIMTPQRRETALNALEA
ncbi:MAG TPA: hypothetical protein VIJ15_02560 [Dermatophilaceae bacterium]